MGVEFGRREPFVELEMDGTGRRVEAELAIGPVVVLPAAMRVAQEVIGQLLDDIFEGKLAHLDLGIVPGQRGVADFYGGKLDGKVAVPGRDAFDLAGVALPIEGQDRKSTRLNSSHRSI